MMNNKVNNITGRRFTLQQQAFFKTDEARSAVQQLRHMVNDPSYNTRATYSSIASAGASFVDKHMIYLSEHPKLSIQHYLSNLRLKTKIRH